MRTTPLRSIRAEWCLSLRIPPIAWLCGWWVFLFFYGLNSGTLYRTEALRAVIGRECLEGSWIVPTLYGEPFLTKPPGMYTAIALASWPFGEVSTASARIPSALAAILTAAAFTLAFRHAFDPLAGYLAGAFIPISLLWLDKAPSAEIDMLQVCWVAIAVLSFWRAVESSRPVGWWLLAMFAVTFGFLTKWTAPAFFYLTALPYLAIRGRWRCWLSLGHILGVLFAIAIVGLWILAVMRSVGWSILADTVGQEAIQRFDPHHGGRSYPWGETLRFPLQVFASALPWSFIAIATLRRSFWNRWDERGRSLLLLLHCWTWPNLGFWTILPEHAVRYVFPMLTGWTALGLMVVIDWVRNGFPMWMQRWSMARWFWTLIVVWSMVKIIYTEIIVPGRTLPRRARETAADIRAAVPTDQTLHLLRLKDEGLMFYYGSNVRRLTAPPMQPLYVLLTEREYNEAGSSARFIAEFSDQQGDRIVLTIMGE